MEATHSLSGFSTFHLDLSSCISSVALSKEHGLNLILSPTSCVSMTKLLNYAKHQFLHLQNTDIIAFYMDLDQDILKH